MTEDDHLELDWGLIDLYARNTGHSIQYDVYRGSVATNRDGIYDLVQLHFHGGAEHTLQGERYAMEAHFVHVRQDDRSRRSRPGSRVWWIWPRWRRCAAGATPPMTAR